MNVFNILTIRTRVILLAFIPLIILGVQSYERYQSAAEKLALSKQLSLILDYLDNASALSDTLLTEWASTRRWLGYGYRTQKALTFGPEMQEARAKVDAALKDYIDFTDKNAVALAEHPQLGKKIEKVRLQLAQLDTVRGIADERKKRDDDIKSLVTRGPTLVILEMRVLIEAILSTTSAVVRLSAPHESLTLWTNAYFSLAQAQFYVTLNAANIESSTAGNLDAYVYGNIVRYDLAEAMLRQTFEQFASQEFVKIYNNQLLGSSEFDYFKSNIQVAKKRPDKRIGEKLPIATDEWRDNTEALKRQYSVVLDYGIESINQIKEDILQQASRKAINTLTTFLALVICIVAISFWIIASISRPLKNLVDICLHSASEKDMRVRADIAGKDELSDVGKAFNSLIGSFEKAIKSVRQESEAMSLTIGDVSRAMDESLKLSVNQQVSTDSISVSVEEMSATIDDVNRMAHSTSEAVTRAHDISIESEQRAETSTNIMRRLIEELGSTAELVHNLNNEAANINGILGVIQAVSEQTNLLALNAAIEAARAGEMGRGFAVVADEVRNLAARTRQSTEEIHLQIESLLEGADKAANNMAALQENGNHAIQSVLENSKAFSVLKEELDSITQMASQIAVAAEEQSSVSREMSQRVHGISSDSKTLAEHAETTLAATKKLADDGHSLQGHIREFKIN